MEGAFSVISDVGPAGIRPIGSANLSSGMGFRRDFYMFLTILCDSVFCQRTIEAISICPGNVPPERLPGYSVR
jgi:hypothetical protein